MVRSYLQFTVPVYLPKVEFHASRSIKRNKTKGISADRSKYQLSCSFDNIEHPCEHYSRVSILAREYALNSEINYNFATRVLNKELQIIGKDDKLFPIVFLTFRKLIKESLTPSVHVVTTVITVAGKRGYFNEASFAFNWIRAICKGKATKPTVITYTAYIQAIGQNIEDASWLLAFDVFDEVINSGLIPNVFTYSALIRVGVRGGEDGARRALSLIPSMREKGVEPDLPIISALISAFGASKNVDGVRSATRSALQLENVDSRLFVDIICAFSSCHAYQEALDIFHSSECPKNVQTCTAAMQAYVDLGNVKDAESIYFKMKLNKFEGGYGFLPNARAHTTILNGYEKSLMWNNAVNLLRKLEQLSIVNGEKDFLPNEIHYNVALSACGKCGEWITAESIFHAMRARGIWTSNITFNTLIIAYGRNGETFRASCLYNLMRNEGIVPDDYSFVGLILGHAANHDLRAALDIKNLILSENVRETVHTYNALIYAAAVCKDYDKVVSLYEMMLRDDIGPNQTTRELVVSVGRKGQKFYEETQLAASLASAAAGLFGAVGMALGRW